MSSINRLGSITLMGVYSFARIKPKLLGMDTAFAGLSVSLPSLGVLFAPCCPALGICPSLGLSCFLTSTSVPPSLLGCSSLPPSLLPRLGKMGGGHRGRAAMGLVFGPRIRNTEGHLPSSWTVRLEARITVGDSALF